MMKGHYISLLPAPLDTRPHGAPAPATPCASSSCCDLKKAEAFFQPTHERFKPAADISSRFTRFSNLSAPAAQSSSNQSTSHCRADNTPTRWPMCAHRAWAAGVIWRWEVVKQRPGERTNERKNDRKGKTENRVNALETWAFCHEKLKRIESHACGFGCVERLACPCQVHKSVHICLRV